MEKQIATDVVILWNNLFRINCVAYTCKLMLQRMAHIKLNSDMEKAGVKLRSD